MLKIGTDIIEIARISKSIENNAFLDRIYTENEKKYILSKGASKAQTAAGIFCAKEAFIKAIGTGFIGKIKPNDIEVLHNEFGAPEISVIFDESIKASVSIAHCREYATATVIIEE